MSLALACSLLALAFSEDPKAAEWTGPICPIPEYQELGAQFWTKQEPDYPVTAWLAGRNDYVNFKFELDSLGRRISVPRGDGSEPFLTAALRTMDHWLVEESDSAAARRARFGSITFNFDIERTAYSDEESRVIATAPQALVSYPFPCPDHGDLMSVRRCNGYIAMRVDSSGFVSDTRFLGDPPPDSNRVRELARQWIFRPYVAPDGPSAGRAIPVWVAVRAKRSCNHMDRILLSRPDSAMFEILDHAHGATVAHLRPALREGRTIAPVEGSSYRPRARQIGSSRFVASKTMSGTKAGPLLRKLLESPAAFEGRPPAKSRRLPEAEYGLILNHNRKRRVQTEQVIRMVDAGRVSLEVLISLSGDFIQLRADKRVVFVPSSAVRPEVQALVDELFAQSGEGWVPSRHGDR